MFKIGDKIKYSFYSCLEIIDIDNDYYHLKDKSGNVKQVYKSLVDKYGKLLS